MDANGVLQYWGMVNEEYANTHEVWVFSINEVVNGQARPELPCLDENGVLIPCGSTGGTGGTGGTVGGSSDPNNDPTNSLSIDFPDLGHAKKNCKLQYMIVKDGKESWLGGKSEISIRAKLHTHNDRLQGAPYPAIQQDYRSNQYSNYLGKLIRQFKRKEIRDGEQINVNYVLQADWQYSNMYTDPIYFDYVIFEKDNWPASLQRHDRTGRSDILQSPSVEADRWNLFYRSGGRNHQDNRQFAYITSWLLNNVNYPYYIPSHSSASGYVNNTEISFNTIDY